MRAKRLGIAALAATYAIALPGATAVFAGVDRDGYQELAYRRLDSDADVVGSFDDEDENGDDTDGVTDSGETVFRATATANADRDGTRGDDGTWGARTVTANGDGDATRGDDGTGAGDGGTRTSNADGDSTRGDDGTWGARTVTANGDGDATRGDDGTSDGDATRGEDGTSDGDDTATTSVEDSDD